MTISDSLAKTVTDLLHQHGVFRPPVPLERIVESLGIELTYRPMDPDMSGALVETSDKQVFIAVNERHHRNRQRFTIAHELGHYFLDHLHSHPHIDREFTVIARNGISSQASDPREMEANAFAANLLLPQEFLIRAFVQTGGFANDELPDLARQYQVSDQALSYRLANLGLLPPY